MADEVKENNKQLVCEIKIDSEMMQKMVDEKVAQIELNIQEIRAKAIDEFAEKLSLEISESIIWGMLSIDCKDSVSDEIFNYVIDTSKKIAEHLKAGGTDGNK